MKPDASLYETLIPSLSTNVLTPGSVSSVTPTSKVDDSAKKKTYEDVAAMLCALCAVGTAGVCVMSCILAVPVLSIIFSQTLRWDANDSACCSEDKPKICNCEENFPEFMMILGVVSVVFACLAALLSCIVVYVRNLRGVREEGTHDIISLLFCVSLIYVLVALVLAILMFVYMLQSDSECGKELFAWGIVLLVFFCISVVGSCCQATCSVSYK
jgi:hypothetical protein